jgi:hypothetical protein
MPSSNTTIVPYNQEASWVSANVPGASFSTSAGGADGYSPSMVPQPTSTGSQSTSQAIAAGQLAYGQLPGYAADITKIGGNISSELAGQLPGDVASQIAQAGAERGVSTGSPGSPNSNASYLQALGLNSLQMQQTGMGNLSTTLAQLPGGNISQNPNFYVSPALQQQAATTNANNQTEANAQAAGLAAAKAGAAAAGGGGTTIAGMPNLSAPGASAGSAPYYQPPPTVGWTNAGQPIGAGDSGTMADIPGGNMYGNTSPQGNTGGGGASPLTPQTAGDIAAQVAQAYGGIVPTPSSLSGGTDTSAPSADNSGYDPSLAYDDSGGY